MAFDVRKWALNLKEKIETSWNGFADKAEKSCRNMTSRALGQAADLCVYTSRSAAESTRGIRNAAAAAEKKISSAAKTGFAAAEKVLSNFWGNVSDPFVKMYRAPGKIAEAFRQGGFGAAASYTYCGIRRNRKFFTTIANYGAPVLSVFVLCNVISSASSVTYALEVRDNNEHIGYIADESVLTTAQDMLRQRIIHTDGSAASFEISPELSVVAVNESLIADVNAMTDNLIQMSNENIFEAEGLYIDNKFYGAVTDAERMEEILDGKLDQYRTGAANEVVSFVKNIELRKGLYLQDSMISNENMEAILNSTESAERTYTVEEGDSPLLIAEKVGIPYSEFKSLNPEIEKVCMIGQEALVSTEKPFLSVKVVREETTTETIKYQTEVTKDHNQYVGYSKTVQAGKNGSSEVTASVEYIDGYEASRTILANVILEEPVTAKVIQGTRQPMSYSTGKVLSASRGSGQHTGSFLWPVSSGGYISCYYSSYHRAIDIACPYGTPILASAAGKVIRAGWDNSYGKVVVIDHGDGVQTLYAHNSTLNVAAGDYVEQGQVIAGAGSTGYSFGNHCHFEVRINGSRNNPLNYLN